jgi:hypothetical protein
MRWISEYVTDARVTIEVSGKPPFDDISDSLGVARIIVSSDHIGKPGVLIVEADGYKRYRQHIDLVAGALPDVVPLERLPGTSIPTPTHLPPTDTPTPEPVTDTPKPIPPTFNHCQFY